MSSAMVNAAGTMFGMSEKGNYGYDRLLKGVCDIHLHCRPDSRERSVDEYGFMKEAMTAGYRAVMFKSNDFSCHDRAYLIRQALPGAECFGSFCMNRVHGDKVNPFAARKAVETSGGLCRCIWMPTLDAANAKPNMLTPAEREALGAAIYAYRHAPGHIDCTGCYQCIPCPHNVAIGYIFAYVYNNYILHKNKERAMADYTVSMSPVQRGDPASSCVACGECLAKCPQHLDIPNLLAKVKETMGK